MKVSYQAQGSAYQHVFQKTRLEKTVLKGLYFLWLKWSLTLILCRSSVRRECVLNIHVHKELSQERFPQIRER